MARNTRYSPELRERAVTMVVELDEQTVSDGLPMLAWISRKLLAIEAELGWEDRPSEPTAAS